MEILIRKYPNCNLPTVTDEGQVFWLPNKLGENNGEIGSRALRASKVKVATATDHESLRRRTKRYRRQHGGLDALVGHIDEELNLLKNEVGVLHVNPAWKLYRVDQGSSRMAHQALTSQISDHTNSAYFLPKDHILVAEVDVIPITVSPESFHGFDLGNAHEFSDKYNDLSPDGRILELLDIKPRQIAMPTHHYEPTADLDKPILLDIDAWVRLF